MAEIVIMGELLVEIMRAEEDVQLYDPGAEKYSNYYGFSEER